MQEITSKERNNILEDHKYYKSENILYWYTRIVKRLEYLNPLFNEFEKRNINLKSASKELYTEVFEIKEIKKILELYIKQQ